MSHSAPRRRLACTECTRRKVRCDKEIPCGNCIKKGAPQLCDRESEPVQLSESAPGDSRQSQDSSRVDSLLRRVSELEAALNNTVGGTRGDPEDLQSAPRGNGPRQGLNPQPVVQEPQTESAEDAAQILEFLAWGRVKDPEYSTVVSPQASRVDGRPNEIEDYRDDLDVEDIIGNNMEQFGLLQFLLPSRRQILQLVEYHNDCLLWFHGSYCALSLSSQLEDFFEKYHGRIEIHKVNLQWMALMFAVLTGSMTSAPDSWIRNLGFGEKEQYLLARKWYKATVTCLNLAEYTAYHSIHSVQAIATLTSSAHLLGYSPSQSVLLASAIRIAQSLGLHRLISDTKGSLIDQETGRRVWAQLCTQDWFGVSFSETYLVNPLHSRSEPPRNCHDHDLAVLPEDIPTITSYSRFLNKIASIMPSLQDGMMASNTLYTKYEQVVLYDKKMRALVTNERPLFLSHGPLDPSWPFYIPWARRALAISCSHKIIMIQRKFLALSFTNSAFASTRRTCITASKTILREHRALVSEAEDSPTLWSNQAFAVSASIILCLDLLYRQNSSSARNGDDDQHYALVTEAVETLSRMQRNNMIASRGTKLLRALLCEVDGVSPSFEERGSRELDGSRKRKATEEARHSNSGKRTRRFSLPVFVKAFCDSSPVESNATETTAEGTPLADKRTRPLEPERSNRQQLPQFHGFEAVTDSDFHAGDLFLPSQGNKGTLDYAEAFEMSNSFDNLFFLASNDVSMWV